MALIPSSRQKSIAIATLAVVVFGLLTLLGAGNWTPPRAAFPVQGIDVSHHQGKIAWDRLQSQGVDFAYIKATEGGDHIDVAFRTNWDAAASAGIRRGAYHFFTLCRPGAEQAANFIGTVPVDPEALPPVIDLEFLGNCKERPAIADFDKELSAFISQIEAHYRKPVVLYLTAEFDRQFEVSKHFPRPIWARSILREPSFGARDWTIWQASNFRRLDGIEGRVDWNAMRAPPP